MDNTQHTIEQSQTPTNSEITPYLKGIYDTYALWKSLPALFKFPPPNKHGERPTPIEFAEQMGIDDETILELITIPTQIAFATRFKVHPDTLSDWNKTLHVRSGLDDMRKWAKHLSKNVLTSLYNKAVRKGDAFEVKLWFQLIENYEEKSKVGLEAMGDIHFNIILNKNNVNINANQPRTVGEANTGVGIPQ